MRTANDQTVTPTHSRRAFLRGATAVGAAIPAIGLGLSASEVEAAGDARNVHILRAAQGAGSQVVIGAWAEPAMLLSGALVTGAAYQQIQGIPRSHRVAVDRANCSR